MRLEATAEVCCCDLVGIASSGAGWFAQQGCSSGRLPVTTVGWRRLRPQQKGAAQVPRTWEFSRVSATTPVRKGRVGKWRHIAHWGRGWWRTWTRWGAQGPPCPWLPWPGLPSGGESLCRAWRRAALPTAGRVCYSSHQFSGWAET